MYTRDQIATLAEKWLNGTISGAEKEVFEHWYNRRKPEELHWLTDDTEDAVRKRIFESVKMQIAHAEEDMAYSFKTAKKYRSLKWAGVAACALLVVAAFFFRSTGKQPPVVHRPSDTGSAVAVAPPSAIKAILTLADGRQIPLDSITGENAIAQGTGSVQRNSTGGLVYAQTTSSHQTLYNKVTVPRGSKILSVVLSDGTKVWLNVESSLHYPVIFNEGDRKVSLTGEAYFEVQKNAGKKFIVESAGSVTEVLGTHFNINTYTAASEKITLLEGAVRVRNNAGAVRELSPGEQATAAPGNLQVKKVGDIEAVMAWKNGLFKLNNAEISGIMQQLSQWYDVDVVLKGNLKGKTFSGMISRNTQLSTVLEMLAMTKEVKFETKGKTITVYPY
ncbi:MAG: FecR family protein [Agriterribacter sp.]